MTDFTDLLAAITHAPGDDTPRLIAADWLDDRGESDYAQFIRHQIHLHHCDPWDGFAIRARNQRKNELTLGLPYRHYLPPLPLFLQWHPEKAFRRGFGSGVIVRQLSGLIEAGQRLFDLAPIDELWLGPATLDEWRQVARSPWLLNVRKVHLMLTTGLIEPVRCLAESPYSLNIDEIWFDTLATPAAGTVMEALAESKLAGQLEGLHLRLVTAEASEEVSQSLQEGKWIKLKNHSLQQCEFPIVMIEQLMSTIWADQLEFLNLNQTILGRVIPQEDMVPQYENDQFLWTMQNRLASLKSLNMDRASEFSHSVLLDQEKSGWRRSVRSLSLNHCHEYRDAIMVFISAFPAQNVLELHMAHVTDKLILGPRIISSELWHRLRMFDLSGQEIDYHRDYPIADIPIPPELETLILSVSSMSPSDRAAMDARFGDRIVWVDDTPAHGLAR